MNLKDKLMKDLTVEEYLTIKVLEKILTVEERLEELEDTVEWLRVEAAEKVVETALKPREERTFNQDEE